MKTPNLTFPFVPTLLFKYGEPIDRQISDKRTETKLICLEDAGLDDHYGKRNHDINVEHL